ncbi:hypothetical protein FKM82_022031 [Ascaphus truei]
MRPGLLLLGAGLKQLPSNLQTSPELRQPFQMSVKKPLDPRLEPFSSGGPGVCSQVLDWQTPRIGSAAWPSAPLVLPAAGL